MHVATRVVQSMGKLWWEYANAVFLESRALEQKSWVEFREVFYSHYRQSEEEDRVFIARFLMLERLSRVALHQRVDEPPSLYLVFASTFKQ